MAQFSEIEKEMMENISEGCKTPAELTAKLKGLFAGTLEKMLEAELDEHLGYEKNSVAGNGSGNSRNGHGHKTIRSEWGEAEIEVPRDRNGSYEPQAVEKRQTRTDDIEQRIISMYAKGMSTRDIEDHLRDIYGIEASSSLISRITDKIMPAVTEWQNRPLETVYPIVFLDGIVFKVRRDAKVVSKCMYTVLGINMSGRKEILGMWLGENESASFWASICNDIRNRGVCDILIACRDNLGGFSQAIEAAFPHTEQQLCVIHQIRNSTRYVSSKDIKALMRDLKLVYGAVNEESALAELEDFRQEWGKNTHKSTNPGKRIGLN